MNGDVGWLRPFAALPHVTAVMTTRSGGKSRSPWDTMNLRDGIGDSEAAVAGNVRRLGAVLGAAPVLLDQIHGAAVVRLRAADAAPGAPPHRADASVSTDPRLPCTVLVADCLPVLFATTDRGRRGVAAAHAGWRGLAAGVLEATLAALCAAADCAPAEVHAWLGPCIGPAHFEVGSDVLAAFGRSGSGPRFAAHGAHRWLADLAGLARDRLQRAGVQSIEGAGWCTCADASRWYSYRRDGVTGRMAAAIRLHT